MPTRVGVVGGGRMGAGIAHAFLLAGAQALIVEVDEDAAARAHERVLAALSRGGDAAQPADADASPAARLSTATDASALAGCGLVVEAVPEDLGLKREALARIEHAIAEDAVIATNTSSLPLADLATAVRVPGRFLGLHFFNPVPASALVEVVIGAGTEPALAERACGWVEALGKTAIVVRDSPGFASSRLGVALALEAIRMLEEGVASADDIDRAMELGYRHPMGPLRTTDLVGLDVRLGIAEGLQARLGDRFAPPELLRRMVADGQLGRKSGRGFYEWRKG